MKKIFLPFLLLLFLAACNNDSKTKSDSKDTSKATTETTDEPKVRTLVGKWKPIAAENLTDKPMDESDRRDILDSMTVEFRGDGYFGATLKGETRGGSYMFSEADGKLITKRDSGDEETLQVSWKGDNLVLADEKLKVTLRRL